MCPVAAESKNSKPSSKKNINNKINLNLDKTVGEDNKFDHQDTKDASRF